MKKKEQRMLNNPSNAPRKKAEKNRQAEKTIEADPPVSPDPSTPSKSHNNILRQAFSLPGKHGGIPGIHKAAKSLVFDPQSGSKYGTSYSCGSGLSLLVKPNNAKIWRFSYRFNDKQNHLIIGSFPQITAEDAFKKTAELRSLLSQGIDPKTNIKPRQRAISFADLVMQWQNFVLPSMRETTKKSYSHLLNRFLLPQFSNHDINTLSRSNLSVALQNLALKNPATASKCASLLSAIFTFAVQIGLLEEPPTSYLTKLFQKPKAQNYPAIVDVEGVGSLLRKLEIFAETTHSSLQIRTLARVRPFLPLRITALTSLTKDDVDLDNGMITIRPVDGNKAKGTSFYLPIPDKTLEILRAYAKEMAEFPSAYFFPTVYKAKGGFIEGCKAMGSVYRRAGIDTKSHVDHGWRSVWQSWADEHLVRQEISSIALQHVNPFATKIQRVYSRNIRLEVALRLFCQWMEDCLINAREGKALPEWMGEKEH